MDLNAFISNITTLASEDANQIPLVLTSAILIKRSYIYRKLKNVVLPSTLLFLAYRLSSGANQQDLLAHVQRWLSTIKSNSLRRVLGDLTGLVLLASVARLGQDAVSFLLSPNMSKQLVDIGFSLVKLLPMVSKKLTEEKAKTAKEFERDLKTKSRAVGTALHRLPSTGMTQESILTLMREHTALENANWMNGRVTGAVYHGDQARQQFLNEVFGLYSLSNPLHADMWPSTMKFEAEIVAMTASLVDGGSGSLCGCTSSGGTESILLAIKAHRDFYRKEYGITEPELIAATSAHAAVNKACDCFGIKLVQVPMDPATFQVDLVALKRAIGPNTIMMYASAPAYAQGVVDPIEEMGRLGVHFNIGLHVDCCLGGFVLPFAKRLGYDVPPFDFTVPGVTSMSLDTHKYGFALKGTSVVLYRTQELRRAQYFCYADWSGGMYTTPGIAGSRSGGMIAQCWASMVSMGEDGYKQNVTGIMNTTRALADGVRSIHGLRLLGEAKAMIVCFEGVDGLNIYAVADEMSKRGKWSLGSHQHPASIHLCITVPHVGREAEFLSDLRASVEAVRQNPEAAKHGSAAVYGLTSTLPAGPVNELLQVYNDVVLTL